MNGSPYGERLPGREQSDAERGGGVKRGLPLFMAVSATRVRRTAWREREARAAHATPKKNSLLLYLSLGVEGVKPPL